jgi:hypothetical protein
VGTIRQARGDDRPRVHPSFAAAVAAGETCTAAVHLWRSLGFEVVGTVPGAFDHPRHGYVGLHVMFRRV